MVKTDPARCVERNNDGGPLVSVVGDPETDGTAFVANDEVKPVIGKRLVQLRSEFEREKLGCGIDFGSGDERNDRGKKLLRPQCGD
ncbi:hypothetical protein [Gluconacetobacter azotocaptans]|uniref:hypothetical protein n=1 Tax=Gluconacetobacter azotocaptans TaxID=142834 RepID=UPI001F047320|nr:hypothetical protein [Gluconacetobacter azotocaptans]